VHSTDRSLKKYRVCVGHTEVSVRCHGREEAVRLAREKLSADLPRLYDVIWKLTADRFHVAAVR